jgi:hypothetical protein
MSPREERSDIQRALVGPAGEHFVLYKLYQQGFMASLAPRNAPAVDILVLNSQGEEVVATIQVKTRTRGADRGWHMQQKHELLIQPRFFYAFVDFEVEAGFESVTYIVPSDIVAKILRQAHETWLHLPGKKGQQRNDSNFRRLLPQYSYDVEGVRPGWLEAYREKWDQLRPIGHALA